ncbi:MAG: cytochrome c biogenesis protein [Leptospiraceae bacterium]|nr:cytochrome c biogenesis protein [Leptospiraceae bacterium]MDW8305715.1 cytochrome c biogenesis protein CcsA [Leptospiraceae bacterium]
MGYYVYVGLVFFGFVLLAFLTLFFVPSDAMQGVVQRIFYYHVPTAWVSFTAFILGGWYSFRYLRYGQAEDDGRAENFILLGWLFTTGVLITGPLWAKPIWGDFWNWSDERLITFFVMWLSYGAYFLFRLSLDDLDKKAKYGAVLALLFLLNIPLVYFSIILWETPSHPGPVVMRGGLRDWRMTWTFWYAVLWFHLFLFMLYIPAAKWQKLKLVRGKSRQ